MKKYAKLFAAIGVCQLTGIIGSVFTIGAIPEWYATLNKPSFTPPNWLFGPVWIVLYTLMGISLYLVWKNGFKSYERKVALWIFATQLVLNSLWSIIFFGLRSPFWALVEIGLLWIAIIFTIIAFYRISKIAGLLLILYLLWTSFAAVLNLSIVQLN